MHHCENALKNFDAATMTICCVPTLCHVGKPIHLENLSEAVKVICNNETCLEGEYMHKLCFDHWEYTVLTFLRSTGRARSWSEKQRLQNLWTKKGYDLAYKACGCKCGKGHLRKDLDWTPPYDSLEEQKRKKHRKKKNDKPTLSALSKPGIPVGQQSVPVTRIRSSSISSTSSTSGSPPSLGYVDCPLSPTWGKQFFVERRERHVSGSLFSRRQDYSSFNTLPRNKINSYHIKTEDEGNQGNDEIRSFILSTLSANKTIGVACVFCYKSLIIFDRYPLIDGTFFLSPQYYSRSSVPVKIDCNVQYLNAVCMGCLEGWNTVLLCKYCQSKWVGSDLILGTMYSYDVLAAVPCCQERLRCNECRRVILSSDRRLQYFSDYSQSLQCPSCGMIDYHFVKPLSTYNLQNISS